MQHVATRMIEEHQHSMVGKVRAMQPIMMALVGGIMLLIMVLNYSPLFFLMATQ